MATDISFGFDSALQTATDAIDKIQTTAESHHRVMVVEVMGRNAGWIALQSGIAGAADVILIPEIPFQLEKVCDCCLARSRHGKAFTIVAVSEGAKPVGGQVVVDRVVRDSPDPIRLGGVSEVLAEQISQRTKLETRATILGHVQRGGMPCSYDRVLATRFGHAVVELITDGKLGELVVMQDGRLRSVPITAVAEKQRLVPPDHPLITAARAIGTCFGD